MADAVASQQDVHHSSVRGAEGLSVWSTRSLHSPKTCMLRPTGDFKIVCKYENDWRVVQGALLVKIFN